MAQRHSVAHGPGTRSGSFDNELVSSPVPFIAAMLVFPVFASLYAWNARLPEQTLDLAVMLFGALALCGVIARIWSAGARVGVVLELLGLAVYLRLRMGMDGGLLLVCLPVVVAGALFSMRGMLATAGISALSVLLLPSFTETSIGVFEAFVAICSWMSWWMRTSIGSTAMWCVFAKCCANNGLQVANPPVP